MVLQDGKANGTRALLVRTGGGLTFTVLPDRGLDIAEMHFGDLPISYISPSGVTHPAYAQYDGKDAHARTFFGGALTTCGLLNVGPACTLDGQKFPLHGNYSNTPLPSRSRRSSTGTATI